MDPRQIFKNVSDGNDTVSHYVVISVIKEEGIFTKEMTSLIALNMHSNQFDQHQFSEVLNAMRRYAKEISSASDEQRKQIKYNYIYKMITNGTDQEVSGFVVHQKCKNALEKGSEMKKEMKKLIKKVDQSGSMSQDDFNEIMNGDSSSSSSSSSSSEEGDWVEKSIQFFDQYKEEGRNSLSIRDCLECIQRAGMKENDISAFLEVADIHDKGELEREVFESFLEQIQTYFKTLPDELKNKEILNDQYKVYFATLIFNIADQEGNQQVSSQILKHMMEKLVGKSINGRPVQLFELNGIPETATFNDFVSHLKDSEEEPVPVQQPQQQNSEQIPMSTQVAPEFQVDEDVTYNPSKFTVFYMNCFLSWIDSIFG